MPPAAAAKNETRKRVELAPLEKAAILVMYLDREAARSVLRDHRVCFVLIAAVIIVQLAAVL